MKQIMISIVLLLSFAEVVVAAEPPNRVNYQGVLRDDQGQPMNGEFAMIFRFYDTDGGAPPCPAVGGTLLLTDGHLFPQLVAVTGGLFNVHLGGGSLGPGTVNTLAEAFRDNATVYMEVKVGNETLCPRVQIVSAAYALNADHLDGKTSAEFLDTSGTAQTKSGPLTVDTSAVAGYAVEGRGQTGGGYFWDTDQSGDAYVGSAGYGIVAYGNTAGGYFQDTDSSGHAKVGFVDYGIFAYGSFMGGYFQDLDNSGYARVGFGDYGIQGYGNAAGGYFKDNNNSGYANVGSAGYGIQAYGNEMGGYFIDLDSSGYARVGYGSFKIQGGGSVSFVQNHPADKDAVIVYAAPEGDEVATYTRGTARLIGGEARVQLGETFKWVTNPDLGLTAHVTPRGEWGDLYVDSVTTEELVVRSQDGTATDVTFDYLVYGLRIGFEEISVVQEKTQESYIPSMKDHRERYERQPELRRYNALERFKTMRMEQGLPETVDMTASTALKAAIEEYDPAVHGPVDSERPELEPPIHEGRTNRNLLERPNPEGHTDGPTTIAPAVGHPQPKPQTGVVPMDPEGNFYGRSFRPDSPDLAGYYSVSEQVEMGDVLVLDPYNPGLMKPGEIAADPTVVGIVSGEPGVLLGRSMTRIEEADADLAQQLREARSQDDEEVSARIWKELEAKFHRTHAPVALSGIVFCKVDAGYGSIRAGDLLTSSQTRGHARRADDPAVGTIVGKALEPIEQGTGLIKVLVMLR